MPLYSALVAAALLTAALRPAAGAGYQGPSFLGPTGYVLVPSADTPPIRTYALGLHHRAGWNYITSNYCPFRRAEVGVAVLDPSRPGPKTELALHAKYVILNESRIKPRIAVGTWDPFDWIQTGSYAVASKNITLRWPRRPLHVTAGIGSGRFNSGFWAVQIPLSGSVALMGEFDGHDLNGNLRIGLPRGFVLDVGSVNWELGVGAAFRARW